MDGELIIDRLEKKGFVRVDDVEKAELIIVNSCGFIESAKKESLDAVMGARAAFPDKKILLAGCLAERYSEVFKEELCEADGIFGNGDLSAIDSVVDSIFNGQRPVVRPPQKGVCCGDRNTLLSFRGSAYVKITEGCDNRCTFCAIPLIRGSLRSRPEEDILKEIQTLVQQGTKEINLIGQDLAAYGCGLEDSFGGNWHNILYKEISSPVITDESFTEKHGLTPLASLLKKISSISGDFWIRLLYIHPDHFTRDILEVIKEDKRFLPYFDIPFQSGSDSVIHAMNRKGSFKDYVYLVKKIREILPEAAIRTTFLTGFPGETEEDAETTQKFLKEIQSDWSGCFSYSTEEDTPAYKMKKKVPHKLAQKRADQLQKIQASITRERLKDRTQKTYQVLVEEIVEPSEDAPQFEGLAIGRAWFQAPEVDGSVVIRYDRDDERALTLVKEGNLVNVRVTSSSDLDVDGELLL